MLPLLLLLWLASTARGKQVCCYGDLPVDIGCYHNNFPFDSMPLPDCNDEIQVSMRVYTRGDPEHGKVITKTTVPSNWRPGKRTHFVVHGYTGSRHAFYLHSMKDAALTDADVNMVVVGWSGGSRELWYPKSASNTRVVGTEIALTAQNLVENYGADWSSIWCAGHSLGSHVCGHAGKRTRGGKLGRIIGLDPAGPWFEDKDSPLVGLDRGDATEVDVMHTHGEADWTLSFGTMKPMGHKDFYPNGGGEQPGCILDPIFYNETEPQPMGDLTPACSHNRVLWLYIESLQYKRTGCKFLAYSSCTNPFNIPASCSPRSQPEGAMGHAANLFPATGFFYLETNAKEPYCKA